MCSFDHSRELLKLSFTCINYIFFVDTLQKDAKPLLGYVNCMLHQKHGIVELAF